MREASIVVNDNPFQVSQQPAACRFELRPASLAVVAAGGSGSLTVSAGTGCAWTASRNDSWITVTSGASGSGNGSVAFTVAANTGSARTGTITVAGQRFTVTQAGTVLSCNYSLSSKDVSMSGQAGTGSVHVSAGTGCSWMASSNASWITVTSGSSGNGNGSVGFSVSQNPGGDRTGTMAIAGQPFTVRQAKN